LKLRHVFSPAELPSGTDGFNIAVNADGTALLRMMCPGRSDKMCGVALVKGAPDADKKLHGWNGNFEAPTITPSIGCDLAPRCGWHGHIINGERTP